MKAFNSRLPRKKTSVPDKTLTSKNPEAAAARHNLAAVLKRNADRGMFTVNLSSGHERTLYAFLDPACPNCRLLEPALKRGQRLQCRYLPGFSYWWRGIHRPCGTTAV